MALWAALRDRALAIVKLVTTVPARFVRWVIAHPAYAVAGLWLAGMGAFVGLTGQRAIESMLAEARARSAAQHAKDEARIEAEVLRILEKRPNPDAGGDARPVKVAAPRGEVIELLDIDEIEAARGGKDEAAREAIAGLQEPFDEEGSSGKADSERQPMESVTVTGKDGETVTIRMKKGGFAGWIARNRKYRKRKLGDKETLEIMAQVTGGVGTKVNVNPNGPMGSLAAIAAIRGSARAEAEETGVDKASPTAAPEGSKPGDGKTTKESHPSKRTATRPAEHAATEKEDPKPGGAKDAKRARRAAPSGMASLGELELELLGLSAAIAITSPADAEPAPSPKPDPAEKAALESLATMLAPVVRKNGGALTTEVDRVELRFPTISPSAKVKPATDAVLVRDIALALKQMPACTIEARIPRPSHGKDGDGKASQAATDKRIAVLQALLRARGFASAQVSSAQTTTSHLPSPREAADERSLVFRIAPPKPVGMEAKPRGR